MVMPTSNIEIRKINMRNICKLIYFNGSMTNQEIAKKLQISVPTVSLSVKSLMEQKIIEETARQKSSGGRRASIVSVNPSIKYAIGIAISENHIRLCLLNFAAEVVGDRSIRERFTYTSTYWDKLKRIADDFKRSQNISDSSFLGFGISLPGVFVEKKGASVVIAPTLGSAEINIDKLKDLFDSNTIIMNDAQLAGMSYMWKRHADEHENTIYLLLGKGVGGAILPNSLSTRFGSKAAEFGHMVLHPDGKLCSCGCSGCLEAYCSSSVLYDGDTETIDDFFDLLRAGDEKQKKIWDQYLVDLGIAIHNIRMVFDSKIVLGGEVSWFLPTYEKQLKAEVDKHNPFHEHSSFLSIGNYGFWDSSYGAAISQIERFLNNLE